MTLHATECWIEPFRIGVSNVCQGTATAVYAIIGTQRAGTPFAPIS